MIALMLGFLLLYGAIVTGRLKPPADELMSARLEPIIFIIIGYYFGRLPAQQNEKSLKDEIGRQAQKADAAQHAKEQAQQSREAVEEKLKNVIAALAPSASTSHGRAFTNSTANAEEVQQSVVTALNILKS